MKLKIEYEGKEYNLVELGMLRSCVFVDSEGIKNSFLTRKVNEYSVREEKKHSPTEYWWESPVSLAYGAMEELGAKILEMMFPDL